jgi:hypothetical protein
MFSLHQLQAVVSLRYIGKKNPPIMKNKGRKHKAGYGKLVGIGNCKGCLVQLSRPITSMSFRGTAKGKFDKSKWIKRIRGYSKSQTKTILEDPSEYKEMFAYQN